jgi:hypothetical protein
VRALASARGRLASFFRVRAARNPATVYVAPRRGFDFKRPDPAMASSQRAKGAEFVRLAMLGINGVRDESAR